MTRLCLLHTHQRQIRRRIYDVSDQEIITLVEEGHSIHSASKELNVSSLCLKQRIERHLKPLLVQIRLNGLQKSAKRKNR